MIAGLDSATPPTAAQAQAARAAGVGLWSGYLATRAGVGLLRAWSRSEFETARTCGGTPIAFCSGNDDPVACKALATAWSVRLCLDVEGGIRGDGPWVQGWLDASGAGLYGNAPVFANRRAPFYVLAGYPGVDPRNTWSASGRPQGPCGWQWQGTHGEFGASVDRGWYDDWFKGTTPQEAPVIFPQSFKDATVRSWLATFQGPDHNLPADPATDGIVTALAAQLTDDGSNWDTVCRAFHADANSKPWVQIAADLKAGKYGQPSGSPSAVPPHTHTGSVTVH